MGLGSSYRVHRPSRFRTASPPSCPISTAVAGDTAASIADAARGDDGNLVEPVCAARGFPDPQLDLCHPVPFPMLSSRLMDRMRLRRGAGHFYGEKPDGDLSVAVDVCN